MLLKTPNSNLQKYVDKFHKNNNHLNQQHQAKKRSIKAITISEDVRLLYSNRKKYGGT